MMVLMVAVTVALPCGNGVDNTNGVSLGLLSGRNSVTVKVGNESKISYPVVKVHHKLRSFKI